MRKIDSHFCGRRSPIQNLWLCWWHVELVQTRRYLKHDFSNREKWESFEKLRLPRQGVFRVPFWKLSALYSPSAFQMLFGIPFCRNSMYVVGETISDFSNTYANREPINKLSF